MKNWFYRLHNTLNMHKTESVSTWVTQTTARRKKTKQNRGKLPKSPDGAAALKAGVEGSHRTKHSLTIKILQFHS